MLRSPIALVFLTLVFCCSSIVYAEESNPLKDAKDGLTVNKPSAFVGYALVAPMNSLSTYLIDNDGRIVNEWKSEFTPALSAYLLPNGHLLRPGAERGAMANGPGSGGRIQEFDWDGKLVWDFSFSKSFPDSKLRLHHDICPLPNGNVLVVCQDPKTKDEALEVGRLPPLVTDQVLSDAIIEIKPVGLDGGEIVWEWYAWNHLVQEVHQKKPGFADVSEHPELIDINFVVGMTDRMIQDPEQLAKLRSLGYVGNGIASSKPEKSQPKQDNPEDSGKVGRGDAKTSTDGKSSPDTETGADGARPGPRGPGGRGPGMGGDWLHINAVSYHPTFDQIMLSVHEFSEVWIIDHSTTTQEAASHVGGKSTRGGDLLYRWGNPKAYRCGTNVDQRLFAQHCAHWISDGLTGSGHMLVFNNGANRPDGSYSSVDEIELPAFKDGKYAKDEYVAYGPVEATWRYGSPENTNFNSMLISGCQRLPNGNTFICSGNQGILFEVTPKGEIVWQYKHPGAGFGGPGGFDSLFRGLVPGFIARTLKIDDVQKKKIDELQAETNAQLKSLLGDEQFAKATARPRFGGPGGFGPPPPGFGPPLPVAGGADGPGGPRGTGGPPGPRGGPRIFVPPKIGEILPPHRIEELKLADDLKAKIAELQTSVTEKLNSILTEEQHKQFADMEKQFALDGPPGFGPPGGGRGGPPRGFGPPGGGGPGGPGGRGPGGIFRSYRYGADYAGLKGKSLNPGKKLDEVAAAEARKELENSPTPEKSSAPEKKEP